MKRLLLIRHAKSSWDFPELSDHDRPLNKRGLRDSPMMAQRLLERDEQLDAVISSSAVRAFTLASYIAEVLKAPLIENASLYTFASRELMEQLYDLPSIYSKIGIVGHNPAITAVVNELASDAIDNVPTSGIVAIDCKVAHWDKLNPRDCRMDYFDYPKRDEIN